MKRIATLIAAVMVILLAATGCAQQIYGVGDAIEKAELRGDTKARDDHFKSSATMLAKAGSYEYRLFALCDLKNKSIGIISRGADNNDTTVVYIPEIQTMLSGKEDIAYDMYYLAVLGPIDETTGKGTAVLMADEPDSPPKIIASVTFTVPAAISDTVARMDLGNKTIPCPVYDSEVAEKTYGEYDPTPANIERMKAAKRLSDIDLKGMKKSTTSK